MVGDEIGLSFKQVGNGLLIKGVGIHTKIFDKTLDINKHDLIDDDVIDFISCAL